MNMKIPSKKEFIKYIRDHLSSTGEKPASFGRRVLNDSGAVSRLIAEDGTDPRLSTVNKIVDDIEGNK